MILYGSVAERSKALVLGTSLFGGVGSNPTAAKIFVTTNWLAEGSDSVIRFIYWLAEGSDSVIRFIYLLAKSKNHRLATVFTVFFVVKPF